MEKIKHTRIPQSRMVYKLIALILGNPLRRLTTNPIKVLTGMGVRNGLNILEIGCGPGFFTIPAAKIAGDGKIYALDLSDLMLQEVEKKIEKSKLGNVKTINSAASSTGLKNDSIDLIFCIDVLSDITDIDGTLEEMHRSLGLMV